MEQNKESEGYKDLSRWEELDRGVQGETPYEEESAAVTPIASIAPAALSVDNDFSDVKELPENPFHYFEANDVNVLLSNGSLQYVTTDFVLPGRNGFDVSIARRYDSGCANLVDMDPQVKKYDIITGSRINSHHNQTYGLGYGWSFVLPSIETVPYLECQYIVSPPIGFTRYDYYLHLEDGRNLRISRTSDKFIDYSQKDVCILTKSAQIHHPYVAGLVKDYHIVIEYKNGNKDYFAETSGWGSGHERGGWRNMNFKLVARSDRFGNVICFELNDYGGMTIVDTWGRTLSLNKTEGGLTWKLPGEESGKTHEISYQIGRTEPQTLWAVTNQIGCTTHYDYYNPDDCVGRMKYVSKKYAGNVTGDNARPYLLLKKIVYPTDTFAMFEYKRNISIENEAGGRILSFGIAMRKDVVDETVINQINYEYWLASTKDFIKKATVRRHHNILETHHFTKAGLLSEKEIHLDDTNHTLISKSVYTYSKKLMISAVDQIFEGGDETKTLEKKAFWSYSDDQKANIIYEKEEFVGDPICNREVTMLYGDYNILLETVPVEPSWRNTNMTSGETAKSYVIQKLVWKPTIPIMTGTGSCRWKRKGKG